MPDETPLEPADLNASLAAESLPKAEDAPPEQPAPEESPPVPAPEEPPATEAPGEPPAESVKPEEPHEVAGPVVEQPAELAEALPKPTEELTSDADGGSRRYLVTHENYPPAYVKCGDESEAIRVWKDARGLSETHLRKQPTVEQQ